MDADQGALAGAQAAHHRRALEVPGAVAARGHGDRDRRQHHRHQGREAQEAVGTFERAADFRAGFAGGFKALAAAEVVARDAVEVFDRGGLAGDHEPVGDAAAFLHQAGGRDVGDIEENARCGVEVVQRRIRLLHHQRRQLQFTRADPDGVAGLGAGERGGHLEVAAKDFLLAEVLVVVDLALGVDRVADRHAGGAGRQPHALLIKVVPGDGLPLDGDFGGTGARLVGKGLFGRQELVLANGRRRSGTQRQHGHRKQ